MHSRLTTLLLVVAVALVGAACSKSATGGAAESQMKQYTDALQALIDGNYLDATTKFEDLANKTLDQAMQENSTIRLGDTLFYQGRYREAAEIYREYLTQRDDSPDAPHAAYMRAVAFLRRTPEDSWLMPPAEAREMTDVDLAYGAFVYLIQRYPDSYHALRARYQISAVVQRRCRNHMYVADYYHKRETPAGVMQRLEQGLSMEETERAAGNLAPSMPCVASPRSMLMLAQAYVQLDDPKGFWSTLARTKLIWFPDAQQRSATLTAIQDMASKKGWQQPAQQ